MSDLWNTLPREDCGVARKSNWVPLVIFAAALALACGLAGWYFEHLMEIGLFGGVDCCRMPRY